MKIKLFAFAILVTAVCAPGDSEKIIRGPYLQLGTPSSVVVRWRMPDTDVGIVYYGRDQTNLNLKAKGLGLQKDHVVMVSGLEPDTKYFYAIGNSNSIYAVAGTNSFITSPVPGTPKPTRIWVLGDPGTAKPEQFQVRDAYAKVTGDKHTDLWLMLGDNAYVYGRDEEYQKGLFEVYPKMLASSVCWPTLGNHDARSADAKTQSGYYFDIFTLPTMGQAGGLMSGTEAYYSYDYANIHFVCFNSCDDNLAKTNAMLTWLKKDLAANKLDWAIAYFHHPAYTKGSHDSDDKGDDANLTQVRENVLPILEKGGVDLVLAGHSHDYERTFLMDGHYGYSQSFKETHKKDKGDGREDGDGVYRKPTRGPAPNEGIVYLVAGSSGKKSGGPLNHRAMYFSTNSLGSVILDIKGPRLDFAFINEHAEKLDHFTIIKGKK